MEQIKGGAILTSNHFSPVDNTVVRTLAWKSGKKKLPIVSQETNLAMAGWVGFLMKYADVIPISSLHNYMSRKFGPMLKRELDKHHYVLIYPDSDKSARDNSIAMCRQDYEQKKRAYEAAYGKPLDYQFDPEDIAGWIGQ